MQELKVRVWDFLWDIWNEIRMNMELVFQRNTPETRLRWLRYTYYHDPNVTTGHRRVKEVLRGYVQPRFYPYYERLLTAERSAYQMTHKIPQRLHGQDLLSQMQRLGDRVVQLMEQAQLAQQTLDLYAADSPNAHSIEEAQAQLLQQIEEALALHASIPARLLSLGMQRAERGMEQVQGSIARLSNQLDDIADAYDDLSQHTLENQRRQLESEIAAAIRDLEGQEDQL